MFFVIKVSNKLIARKEADEFEKTCPEQFSSDAWTQFVAGELERSNKKDNINLGGVSRPGRDDSDSDNEVGFEVNMENIMSRFNTYS